MSPPHLAQSLACRALHDPRSVHLLAGRARAVGESTVCWVRGWLQGAWALLLQHWHARCLQAFNGMLEITRGAWATR
jgi:hypothetical protein